MLLSLILFVLVLLLLEGQRSEVKVMGQFGH